MASKSSTKPKSTRPLAHNNYPTEIMMLTTNEDEFVNYYQGFTEKRDYGTKVTDAEYKAVKKILETPGIEITPEFKAMAQKRHGGNFFGFDNIPVRKREQIEDFTPVIANDKEREIYKTLYKPTLEKRLEKFKTEGSKKVEDPKKVEEAMSMEEVGLGEEDPKPITKPVELKKVSIQYKKPEVVEEEGKVVPQIVNVNKEVEEANKASSIAEVQQNEEAVMRLKADLEAQKKLPESEKLPAMVNTVKLDVNEETGVKEQGTREDSVKETLKDLGRAPIAVSDNAEPNSIMILPPDLISYLSTESTNENIEPAIRAEIKQLVDTAQEFPTAQVVKSRVPKNVRNIINIFYTGSGRQAPFQEDNIAGVPKDDEQNKLAGESFAVTEVPMEHKPKYHLEAILTFFGSKTKPMWDSELEKNIYETKYTPEQRIKIMNAIIEKHMADIHVFDRVSNTVDELNELTQLQFKVLGIKSTSKEGKGNALVPISSLVSYADKLAGRNMQDLKNVPVEPLDEISKLEMARGDAPIAPLGPGISPASQTPADVPTGALVPGQVKISSNEAFDKIVSAYRYSAFDSFGKNRVNKDVVEQTKVRHMNVLGNNSMIDPVNQYTKGTALKVAPKPLVRTFKLPKHKC